jgi:hypothetical protein
MGGQMGEQIKNKIKMLFKSKAYNFKKAAHKPAFLLAKFRKRTPFFDIAGNKKISDAH